MTTHGWFELHFDVEDLILLLTYVRRSGDSSGNEREDLLTRFFRTRLKRKPHSSYGTWRTEALSIHPRARVDMAEQVGIGDLPSSQGWPFVDDRGVDTVFYKRLQYSTWVSTFLETGGSERTPIGIDEHGFAYRSASTNRYYY